MAKQITEKTKQIHEIYEQCKKVFEPSLDLADEYSNLEDEDEKIFFVKVSDFFIQQKQQEAIEKGIF